MMTAQLAKTPNYVLLDHSQKIAPELLALNSGQECIAVYGFSDKEPYDAFCSKTERALTPYPLVRGYLQNQIEAAGAAILIIITDADSPNEEVLNASTMQSALQAQEENLPQVTVSYRLTKDEQSPAYRVEECGPDAPLQLSVDHSGSC